MKAGRTATIRVNPRDCISVLDLMDKVGINTSMMSFAQCVSLALSSLLESARTNGALPDPDGFEYLNRMQQFGAVPHQKKIQASNAIYSMGSEFRAPAMKVPVVTETPTIDDLHMKEIKRALQDLDDKKNAGIPLDQYDQAKYDEYMAIVYN